MQVQTTTKKYARRDEWVGIDLCALNNLVVDISTLLNGRPNYNRRSSRVSRTLRDLPSKPEGFEQVSLDILHLDNRTQWPRRLELPERMEAALTALCEQRWGPIGCSMTEGRLYEQTTGRGIQRTLAGSCGD